MTKLEIEKYLNDNHLSYNNSVRNDVGELVAIGDLVYNKTKELQERVEELEKVISGLENKNEAQASRLNNLLNTDEGKLQAKIDELEKANEENERLKRLCEIYKSKVEVYEANKSIND